MNRVFHSFVEFRKNLKAVLDAMTLDSVTYVTRHDKPIAVVLSVLAYEKLKADAQQADSSPKP